MLPGRNNFNKIRRRGSSRRKFIYSKRSYSNPFFRNKRTISAGRDGLSNKNKLIIIAAAVAVSIFIWLIFFSMLFKINKIEISGVGENTAKEIESLTRDMALNKLLGKNNLLLFSKSELGKILNEKFYLQNLIIKKKLPHTLIIALQEKQPVAVWRENDKYFYIDNEGGVINQVDPLNISRHSYPLIENLTNIQIHDRKSNINKPTIDYILNLFAEFKNQKHNFDIERFIIDNDINTVKMAILGGPKIYFNTKEPVGEQAARLDLIVKGKLKDSFKTKEYINLRYGNNIYIK